MTSARPASTTCWMTLVSCSVIVTLASTRTTATSAFSIAACVRRDA
jgi:hypothetical protein